MRYLIGLQGVGKGGINRKIVEINRKMAVAKHCSFCYNENSLSRWDFQEVSMRSKEKKIIYQMALRTFTPKGTLRAATDRLAHVASLGVDIVYIEIFFPLCTMLQIMRQILTTITGLICQ